MPNSYFQFKQFTVWQDRCAMKVTTDGCLFGAIVANELRDKGACRVLDIGTGTGLLSLMMAQENAGAIIEAVEIDIAAANQAKQNIEASPWSGRIQITETDILQFQSSLPYDFIISNPPFYERQLSSTDAGRRMAHHSSGLTLLQLFRQVKRLLKQEGKFYVLLPFYRTAEAIATAKANNLSIEKRWLIKQTPNHSFFRSLLHLSVTEVVESSFEVTIRDENGNYSDNFCNLLRPFYQHIS